MHLSPSRFLTPDVARGIMLAGIAVANAQTAWVNTLEAPMAAGYGGVIDGSLADKMTVVFSAMFVHVRGLPMFATLFGCGLGFVVASLWRRGYPWAAARGVLATRYGFLGLIGIGHAILFYGDIIVTYALCALICIPLLKRSNRTLIIIAVIMQILSVIVFAAVAMIPDDGATVPIGPGGSVTMIDGNVLSDLGVNFLAFLFMLLFFPLTALTLIPTILIGVIMARGRWLADPVAARVPLGIWAGIAVAICFGLGLPWGLSMVGVLPSTWAMRMAYINASLGMLTGPGLVAIIAFAAHRIARHHPRVLYPLVALGKRSLSGYVAQSLLFILLVKPYTLHLCTDSGAAAIVVLGAVVWLITVVGATFLEYKGLRGPLEYLHRRLSYGRSGSLPDHYRNPYAFVPKEPQ